jgi:hypothetical protein
MPADNDSCQKQMIWHADETTCWARFRIRLDEPGGATVRASQISSIGFKVFAKGSETGNPPLKAADIPVDECFLDELQRDDEWNVDSKGFNFVHSVESILFRGKGPYTAEYVFGTSSIGERTIQFEFRLSGGNKEEQDRLLKLIDGCGMCDKYIDLEEERSIIEKAKLFNIWNGNAEALLNHRCRQCRWTRESDILYFVTIMLEEMTKDDGVIDKKEFDHVVGTAVALRMPRKDAVARCVEIIKKKKWQTEGEGFLKKRDWLAELSQS